MKYLSDPTDTELATLAARLDPLPYYIEEKENDMKEGNVIEINEDRACSKCGEKGALKNGLCMTCAAARQGIFLGPIGEKTILAISGQVVEMLGAYLNNVNSAYHQEDKVTLGFTTNVEPGKGKELKITTKLSFVESRVKDERETWVNEAQGELFGE